MTKYRILRKAIFTHLVTNLTIAVEKLFTQIHYEILVNVHDGNEQKILITLLNFQIIEQHFDSIIQSLEQNAVNDISTKRDNRKNNSKFRNSLVQEDMSIFYQRS